MAKRKRLTPRILSDPSMGETPADPAPQSGAHPDAAPRQSTRAPIAQVAGEAAAQSALGELADEMHNIRKSGRMVVPLPLSAISENHMVRDRMVNDPEEMASLKASLVARGQQTPVEVVDLGQGRFGLISGWRRLHALKEIHTETSDEKFAQIQALIKPVESVSDGYVAMVEENEIRANLSFYERAHLACEAVRLGVYPTTARAISILFANATAAKRSKIGSFVKLHEALGKSLRFPAAIPERLGLALVSAAEADSGLVGRLKRALSKTPPQTPEAERAALERALRRVSHKKDGPAASGAEVAPGIVLEMRKGRLVLSGAGVNAELQNDIKAWLARR